MGGRRPPHPPTRPSSKGVVLHCSAVFRTRRTLAARGRGWSAGPHPPTPRFLVRDPPHDGMTRSNHETSRVCYLHSNGPTSPSCDPAAARRGGWSWSEARRVRCGGERVGPLVWLAGGRQSSSCAPPWTRAWPCLRAAAAAHLWWRSSERWLPCQALSRAACSPRRRLARAAAWTRACHAPPASGRGEGEARGWRRRPLLLCRAPAAWPARCSRRASAPLRHVLPQRVPSLTRAPASAR